MKTFLHVGCGSAQQANTTREFARADWKELRLDINPAVAPDIVGNLLDMNGVPTESQDAVFSSHNIEHLFAHEVPVALSEFRRVLKPTGYLVLTCPNLQEIAELVAADQLTEPAYQSPAGPVSAIDMLYGYRPFLATGDSFMAHKCGFTKKVLDATLYGCGFAIVASAQRKAPFFDLWALASREMRSEPEMLALAALHFPK